MVANIPGTVAVVVCYVAILIIGIIAGRKTRKSVSKEAVLVADRSLGIMVSIFTLTGKIFKRISERNIKVNKFDKSSPVHINTALTSALL